MLVVVACCSAADSASAACGAAELLSAVQQRLLGLVDFGWTGLDHERATCAFSDAKRMRVAQRRDASGFLTFRAGTSLYHDVHSRRYSLHVPSKPKIVGCYDPIERVSLCSHGQSWDQTEVVRLRSTARDLTST